MFLSQKDTSKALAVWIASGVFCCLIVLVGAVFASDEDQDLFRLGTVHYQRGQWEFAVKRFDKLIKSGQNARLVNRSRFYLAESLVALKKYGKAQKQLQKFLDGAPPLDLVPQARYRLGEVAYFVGDRETALVELGRFREANPEHRLLEFALPYLGELRISRGELALAAEMFQESLRQFPDGTLANESRFGLARALEKTDSVEESVRFYQYLIDHPESGRTPDSYLQLGKIRFRQGKYLKAEESLMAFEQQYEDHELFAPVCYWLGRIKNEQQDFLAAEKSFQKGLNASPKASVVPALKFELAKCLAEQDRFSDSIANLKAVVGQFRDSEWADDALLLNIQILRNHGQHHMAIKLCREFHQQFPKSDLQLHILEAKSECYFAMGNYKAAETLYAFLIDQKSRVDAETDPGANDARGHGEAKAGLMYKLAVCQIKQEKLGKALEVLQEIDVEHSSHEVKSASLLALSTIQIDRHQFAAACKNLIKYVGLNPDGEEAAKCVVDIALLKAKGGDFQAADEWSKKIETEDRQVETLMQMADIAFAAGQFVFASQWYSEATLNCKDPETQCRAMMGNVWSAKEVGNIQSAIVLAERVVKSFPQSEQAPDALYLLAVLNEKSGNYKAAEAGFRRFTDRYPDSKHYEESVFSLIGLYRSSDPEKLDEMVEPVARLVKSSDDNKKDLLMYEWAWLLKDVGRLEESKAVFQSIVSKYPGSKYADEAMLQCAVFEIEGKEKTVAIQRLKALAKKRLGVKLAPQVNYQLGQLCFESEEYADSFRYLGKVADEYPRFHLAPAARYWAAESKYRLKDWQAAAKAFASIESSKDANDEFHERAVLRLGQSYVKLEKWNSALDATSRLIEVGEDRNLVAQAYFVIGRAQAGLGLFSKSRSAFQKVLSFAESKGTETAAMAQWMIGESWLHQEKFDQAIDAYQRAEILHDYPEWQAAALLQAGKCFQRKADAENAISNYERIISDFSDTEYVQAAREELTRIKNSSASETKANIQIQN